MEGIKNNGIKSVSIKNKKLSYKLMLVATCSRS